MTGHSSISRFLGAAAAATALFLIVSAVRAEDALTLRWKFNKGDKRTFKVDQVQDVPGMMKNTSSQTVTEEITDAAEDKGTIARTVTAIKLDVQSQMMGNVSYDSEKKEDAAKQANPIVMALAGILNQTVAVELNGRGQVSKLGGIDKMVAKLGPVGMMQRGAIEHGVKQSYIEFPEGPVKIGDTWDQVFSFSSPQGQVTLTFRYAYTGNEKRLDMDCAKISATLFAGIMGAKDAGGDDDGDDLGGDDDGAEHPKKDSGKDHPDHPKKDSDKDDKPGQKDGDHPAKTEPKKEPAGGGEAPREVGSGTIYFAIQQGFVAEMELNLSSGNGGAKTVSVLVK